MSQEDSYQMFSNGMCAAQNLGCSMGVGTEGKGSEGQSVGDPGPAVMTRDSGLARAACLTGLTADSAMAHGIKRQPGSPCPRPRPQPQGLSY